MLPNKALSEQRFLDDLVATGRVCNVYLNSGIKIVGTIAAHSGGGDVLWVHNDTRDDLAMIYIHNISTINPVEARSLARSARDEPNRALSAKNPDRTLVMRKRSKQEI
jgi:sRNA-binding regulator protein Hfq